MIEREIKLALPPAQTSAVMQFFTARTGNAGQVMRLDNIYFDTPDLALSQQKCALRLRRTPAGWLQTFKTAGVARNGLHARHEWEMPVAGEALDIERLPDMCDDSRMVEVLRDAAPALIAIFRTDFTRTLWSLLMPMHGECACIEAAIDQGEILADVHGALRRAPISEIELELKSGATDALHMLAAQLTAQVCGLAFDDLSKAQRGYALREGRDP